MVSSNPWNQTLRDGKIHIMKHFLYSNLESELKSQDTKQDLSSISCEIWNEVTINSEDSCPRHRVSSIRHSTS
ncbi:hypothetical protein CEXT_654401 [Caerostris extrusa]|uniref:Uncharacterized protein n=1 Tax=Caerostris extrusa TaxID=172846 RepID=A0AAV4RT93_CAEEX|nr:hypothetical protein CEXT_654401 [Caerostris extrusa]